MKATCVWQKAAKKDTYLLFYLDSPSLFGRFSARGVEKHHKTFWKKVHVENLF
jgi:hypothetical protein